MKAKPELTVDIAISDGPSDIDKMIWIPGGTFRMGSDKHYSEEAPAHRVTVDEFLIDRTPVTNRQFKEFVKATGHVTVAEVTRPPNDQRQDSTKGHQRRLALVRAELLPTLPAGSATRGAG